MLDGGPGAEPTGVPDASLVTDERAELISEIRRLANASGLRPKVSRFDDSTLSVLPRPVRHTSHPTHGYEIIAGKRRAARGPSSSSSNLGGWRRHLPRRRRLGAPDPVPWRRRRTRRRQGRLPPLMAFDVWCSPASAARRSWRSTRASVHRSASSARRVVVYLLGRPAR
jgi:hypothetical protein